MCITDYNYEKFVQGSCTVSKQLQYLMFIGPCIIVIAEEYQTN